MKLLSGLKKTLFTHQKAAQIMGIEVSTLDSLISYSDLPRTVIHKRVFIHRKELEKYITKCTVTTPVLRGRQNLRRLNND